MSCGCSAPSKSSLWAPPQPYKTDAIPRLGENFSCFAQRASDGGNATGAGEFVADKIQNTSISVSNTGVVSDQMKLSASSTKVATSWTATVEGQPIGSKISGLSISTGGLITGTVAEQAKGVMYKVLISCFDSGGVIIDSRELNFYPKKASAKKGTAIKLSTPLVGKTKAVLTSPYGMRYDPTQQKMRMHYGVDFGLAQKDGGDVLSAHDGVVSFCGVKSGYGNTIVVDSVDADGSVVFSTLYAHLAVQYVVKGANVRSGQKIGQEGNTGASRGLHLHFEICMGNWQPHRAIDPVPYLSGTIDVYDSQDPATDEVVQSSKRTVVNGDRTISTDEAKAIKQTQDSCPTSVEPVEEPPTGIPAPSVVGDKLTVKQRVKAVLDADSSLSQDDRDLLLFIALIESQYIPTAANSRSSARGLFQQVDSMAVFYFKKAGFKISSTGREADDFKLRHDVEASTKAAVMQYKECLGYWNAYVASGKERAVNKAVRADKKDFFKTCSKAEILYGVFWHDGCSSMVSIVSGRDETGVDYYRKMCKKYGSLGS